MMSFISLFYLTSLLVFNAMRSICGVSSTTIGLCLACSGSSCRHTLPCLYVWYVQHVYILNKVDSTSQKYDCHCLVLTHIHQWTVANFILILGIQILSQCLPSCKSFYSRFVGHAFTHNSLL